MQEKKKEGERKSESTTTKKKLWCLETLLIRKNNNDNNISLNPNPLKKHLQLKCSIFRKTNNKIQILANTVFPWLSLLIYIYYHRNKQQRQQKQQTIWSFHEHVKSNLKRHVFSLRYTTKRNICTFWFGFARKSGDIARWVNKQLRGIRRILMFAYNQFSFLG